ncbi:Phytochrome-like protein cph2 [Fundidesulfovibrio magnetotacticus]|uniref:diguanylate cyclase n=1 Tax=Fundidesulfovibrio magnetotacticus TaxID=2730080 RepID=A0A6V8LWW9_9BACT|nr:diguanylate cyclase [Fundidesulfovibrio magnetotacticus]GFK95390.1 Phytochrome-like protein cph2 [Fundidesulfovibrio magnetotacticus]
MDTRTVLLLLALGSFVVWAILLAFQAGMPHARRIPYWTAAKFLQGSGSLGLWHFGPSPDPAVVLAANLPLLLGCAGEAWAVLHLIGRTVSPEVRRAVALAVCALCALSALLGPGDRSTVVFALHAALYGLPAWPLLAATGERRALRALLGGCFLLMALLFASHAFWLAASPLAASREFLSVTYRAVPLATYCMLLVSGFAMLLLAKEKADEALSDAQRSISLKEEQYRLIVDTANEGVLSMDREGVVVFANGRMAQLLGCHPGDLPGLRYADLLAPGAEASPGGPPDGASEALLLRGDKEPRWMSVSARTVRDASGTLTGSFAMFTDITESRQARQDLEEYHRKLEALSVTDGLTGIANRRRFDQALAEECSRHARTGAPLSLILLDLDHFKRFNDAHGHVAGDECLRRVGALLGASASRGGDLAARYGGEEFVCILPATPYEGALEVARAIRRGIEALEIPGAPGGVTASLGVLTDHPGPDCEPRELLRRIDRLLYKAKAGGRNRIEGQGPREPEA